MISWSKRSPWPSLWRPRPRRRSLSLPHVLLLGWFWVAQLQQTHLPPIPGPRRKTKTKRTTLRPGLRSTIRGLGLSRCGPRRRVGHFLVFAPLASSRSSIGGPLRRSSKARLLPSRLSSVGQSGLLSPAQVGCCQVCLVFCPHRLGRRSALVRRFLACLRRHCGCLHRLRHRRVSCKLRPARSGTTTTSPTTSTR
jgi:hypothetical protein